MKSPFQIIDLTSGILSIKRPLFVFFMFALFGPLWVSGQTDNGPSSINMKSIIWKSSSELDQTLVAEKGRIDALLSSPDLNQVDQSIYKSCKLLLTYVQQQVKNSIPIDDAIASGYQLVIEEAPKNPELAKLPDHMLGTYLPGLVEMLSAVPVPEPR